MFILSFKRQLKKARNFLKSLELIRQMIMLQRLRLPRLLRLLRLLQIRLLQDVLVCPEYGEVVTEVNAPENVKMVKSIVNFILNRLKKTLKGYLHMDALMNHLVCSSSKKMEVNSGTSGKNQSGRHCFQKLRAKMTQVY